MTASAPGRFRIRVAFVCVLAALQAGAALAVPLLRYESMLVGDPPLEHPMCVTYAAKSGEICVTDEAARAINVFDAGGLHRFQTDLVSRLSMPRDACVDADGGFVLTDTDAEHRRTIRRLNFLGEPVSYEAERPREDWSPTHLSIAADGNYLTVDAKGMLAKHDAVTGAVIWSRPLEDPTWERADLLGRPVEGPDGRIFVANAGVGQVLVVQGDGSSQTSFGSRGTKRGELAFPVSVAIAPKGMLLVVDRMKHSVLVFDSGLRFVTEFGHAGFAPGDLYFPASADAAPDGRVWVAEGFQGRVMLYRLEDPADSGRPSPPPDASATP